MTDALNRGAAHEYREPVPVTDGTAQVGVGQLLPEPGERPRAVRGDAAVLSWLLTRFASSRSKPDPTRP
jgi:hypothetical protein